MIFKKYLLRFGIFLLLFSFNGLENTVYYNNSGNLYSKTRSKKKKGVKKKVTKKKNRSSVRKKKYAKKRYRKKRHQRKSRKRYAKRYKKRRKRTRKRKKQAPAITIGPVLSFPTPESISIWWHLNRTYARHTIEYGVTEYMPYRVSSNNATTYPFLRLPDIVPGLNYYYRIQSGNLKSKILTYKAIKYNPHFRIGIWADNQDGMRIFKKYTIPTLKKQEPTFLLAIGDLVQNGKNYFQWSSQFFEPGGSLFNKTPLLPVRGNHDGESLSAQKMLPFIKQHWYSFQLGPLYLIVLDSNIDYSPGSKQYKWLTKQLHSKQWRSASYRAVALHYPPYTNLFDRRRYYHGRSVRKYLVPLFETYGANIVMSGHAHCYAHGIKKAAHGATHYFVLGGGGGKLDRVRIAKWPHIVKSEIKYHIAIADISREKFELTVINTINRKIIDRVTIKGAPLRDR